MDIGEVARHAGVPVSTLRFYEQKGLIASTGLAACAGCSIRTWWIGWG